MKPEDLRRRSKIESLNSFKGSITGEGGKGKLNGWESNIGEGKRRAMSAGGYRPPVVCKTKKEGAGTLVR